MTLDKFCYRGSNLVLNGEKQNVTETSCTENSIYGLIEMIYQFPGDFNYHLKKKLIIMCLMQIY